MVESFLLQNASYEVVALASLMDRNMNDTLGYLNETLALSLAARTMASIINSKGNNCQYYFIQAGIPKYSATCANYNFSDPNGILPFLNATWYGGAYKSEIKNQTGMTDLQYANFFSTNLDSQPNSFGVVMATALN